MTKKLPAPFDVKLMNLTATVLVVGCALTLLVAGGRWLLSLPVFSIGRIVVHGELAHNNAVTLRANVAPYLTGNFFTVDLTAARHAFEQVPWIKSAMVQREYPSSLRVLLQEHVAAAYWGAEGSSQMVNTEGEVFEANTGDIEHDKLPRLMGPEGQSLATYRMFLALQPVLKPLGSDIQQLVMTSWGGWRVVTEKGAVIELGAGGTQEVLQRVERLMRTLPKVVAQYGRGVDALEMADLRQLDGYALRLHGVTTVSAEVAARKSRR